MNPILLDLRLKPASATPLPVAGWLVPGSRAFAWLSALAEFEGDWETLRFLPLPEAGQVDIAAAVLILGPELAHAAPPPGVQPYVLAEERIVIPREAVIHPPLNRDEVQEFLPHAEAWFVWHPSLGLMRFDAADMLTVSDLVADPTEEPADWSAARTVPRFVDRLWSVASAEPLQSMLEVESQWSRDIGPTRSLQELPAVPGEKPPGLRERIALATAKFWAAWRAWWAKRRAAANSAGSNAVRDIPVEVWVLLGVALAFWLISLMYHSIGAWSLFLSFLILLAMLGLVLGGLRGAFGTAADDAGGGKPSGSAPGARATEPGLLQKWWQRFQQWRSSRSAGGTWLARADQDRRNREIARLLHMLEMNPEDGLRFAIPFGGDLGRGTGIAGNELVSRNLNFQLGSGTGGPVDAWDIDPQQQTQLLAKYRTLAEREQRSGRHHRAAYIYSQLLGDWHSAAVALKAGHYYSEAAVIYQERLKNLTEAAKCFELAGRFDTALTLYRQQHAWVVAGDLCARLGRDAEAAGDYRQAVQGAVAVNDLRTAAEVLEHKLQLVDEALEVLDRSWPEHVNSDTYFDQWFAIAGRHQRHAQAADRLQTLSDRTTPASALKLLPRLQQVRQNYPQAAVQQSATECSWQTVARHLAEAPLATARQLSQFLPPLSPQDRLIFRDGQRFLERRRQAESRPVVLTKTTRTLQLEKQFPLLIAPVVEPVQACSLGWVVMTAAEGIVLQELRVINWNLQTKSHPLDRSPQQSAYAIAAVNEVRHEIWLHPAGVETTVPWPGSSTVWKVVFPTFLPRHWLAVEALPSGLTRVLWIDDAGLAWLTLFTAEGATARSTRVAAEWFADPHFLVPLARGKARVMTMGQDEVFVFLPVSDEQLMAECFDDEGTRIWSEVISGRMILGGQGSFETHVLIAKDDSVIMAEDPRTPEAGYHVLRGWSKPAVAFLPGGLFVIADDQRIAVVTAEQGRTILETPHQDGPVQAIHPAGIGRFSILREDGHVEVWRW